MAKKQLPPDLVDSEKALQKIRVEDENLFSMIDEFSFKMGYNRAVDYAEEEKKELVDVLKELIHRIEFPMRSSIDRDGRMIATPCVKAAKQLIGKNG